MEYWSSSCEETWSSKAQYEFTPGIWHLRLSSSRTPHTSVAIIWNVAYVYGKHRGLIALLRKLESCVKTNPISLPSYPTQVFHWYWESSFPPSLPPTPPSRLTDNFILTLRQITYCYTLSTRSPDATLFVRISSVDDRRELPQLPRFSRWNQNRSRKLFTRLSHTDRRLPSRLNRL